MPNHPVKKNGLIRCGGKTTKGARCKRETHNNYCSVHKPKEGRPTLYRPEFCEQLLDYFDVEPNREIERTHPKTGFKYTEIVPNALPTLAGFCRHIKVGTATLWAWTKVHPDFQDATTRAKAIAEDILVTNALLGSYNPQFSVFVAKNYTDLSDVQETRDITDAKPLRTPKQRYDRIAQLEEDIKNLEAEL